MHMFVHISVSSLAMTLFLFLQMLHIEKVTSLNDSEIERRHQEMKTQSNELFEVTLMYFITEASNKQRANEIEHQRKSRLY